MSDEEYEKLEGLIIKAVQSGKKETSDLVGDVLIKIDSKIGEAVEKYVNGKIRALTKTVEDHHVVVDLHFKEDREWKEKAQPIIDLGNDAKGASKAIIWLTGIIIAITGSIFAIKEILKWK